MTAKIIFWKCLENSPSCSKGSLPRCILNDLIFNLYNHELMFRQIRSKTRFSNWVDSKKDWVAFKKFSILLLPCRAICVSHRSLFFYYDKSWNGKRYPFANVNSFWHLMWKTLFQSKPINGLVTYRPASSWSVKF